MVFSTCSAAGATRGSFETSFSRDRAGVEMGLAASPPKASASPGNRLLN
jgi:hypothetical protein